METIEREYKKWLEELEFEYQKTSIDDLIKNQENFETKKIIIDGIIDEIQYLQTETSSKVYMILKTDIENKSNKCGIIAYGYLYNPDGYGLGGKCIFSRKGDWISVKGSYNKGELYITDLFNHDLNKRFHDNEE